MTAIRTAWWLALISGVAFVAMYLLGAVGPSLIFAGLATGLVLVTTVLMVRAFWASRNRSN